MKIGERGQVTIPIEIRTQFNITADTEIQFEVIDGNIVLRPKRPPINFDKWVGYASETFKELGYTNSDDFLADIRGRDKE